MEKTCHRCGETGHIASKCRAGKGGKGGSGARCFICGKSGHVRRECPGVDDDGAGQSRFKGKSVARGKKKERPQDESDRALPLASAPFIDMHCSTAVFPSTVSQSVRARGLGESFPYEMFGGAVLSCEMDPLSLSFPAIEDMLSAGLGGSSNAADEVDDAAELRREAVPGRNRGRAESVASQSGVERDCPLALGFWVGVPPAQTSAFLRYHQAMEAPSPLPDICRSGDRSAHCSAALALTRLLSCRRVAGLSAGLDYSPAGAASRREDQLTCLRLQLETMLQLPPISEARRIVSPASGGDADGPCDASEYAAGIDNSSGKLLELTLTPCVEVRSISDFERLGSAGRRIDEDLMSLLRDSFATPEQRLAPLLIRISSCGLEWSTMLELMSTFRRCFFSVDCRLTHSKQKLLREYAFDLPIERIVLESNGPLFPPSGYGAESGSHPGHILVTAQALADVKGMELETVLLQCHANALSLLGSVR